jgi:hypothetical protein
VTAGRSVTLAVRACALGLAIVVLGACSLDDGPSREAVRAFLDANYVDDEAREDTWLSSTAVEATADEIAEEINPRDRFTEDEATFMRNGDYIVAVFPEPPGSRVEFDSYDRIRNRYPLLIGGYWGLSPRSYGPLGEGASRTGGGGFRGGGPGSGK